MIYIYKILLILAIAYTGLTLYFEHRQDKQKKDKNTRKTKKRVR